jgi:carbamoyltransferase
MIVCGISALSHDASFSIVDTSNGEILFASHCERFSRRKNDAMLDPESVRRILSFSPSEISWYERPFFKKSRQLYAGQLSDSLTLDDLPERYLRKVGLGKIPVTYHDHHLSHAAAGYFTSPFDEACVRSENGILCRFGMPSRERSVGFVRYGIPPRWDFFTPRSPREWGSSPTRRSIS